MNDAIIATLLIEMSLAMYGWYKGKLAR